jgi:hypothetical protein
MVRTFECKSDNDLPQEFLDAHKLGRLKVQTVIGWLEVDEGDSLRNGCIYQLEY